MSELSGLELRRKIYEARGWTFVWREADDEFNSGFWLCTPEQLAWNAEHPDDPQCEASLAVEVELRHYLPPVETSADISEALLEEACRERGLRYVLYDYPDVPGVGCQVEAEGVNQSLRYVASGATPSEARARAILAILSGGAK